MLTGFRSWLRGDASAPIAGPEVTARASGEYRYNESDDLAGLARNFTSRLDDGEGDHEQAFLDTLRLIFDLRCDGSMLEIGSGFGRIIALAVPRMAAVVGLEPDFERFRYCRDTYHDPPRCRILQQMSHEFLSENPGASFDVVVLSMVLQHVATDAAPLLLGDAASLVKPSGVVVVATTHVPERAKGFTFSRAEPSELYLSREVFDTYARDVDRQDRGVPVRRFSRAELSALVAERFDILHWQQFSYLRPGSVEEFARRLGVPASELVDSGDSQFVVLRRRGPRGD